MPLQPLAARDAIAALQGHEAWAIIRRSTRAGDRDTVGLVGGRRSEVESILDVPLEDGRRRGRSLADRLLAIPFRQVASAGSRPTTTARRWWSSTSRPRASSPSPRSSRRSTTCRSSSPTAAGSRPTTTSTPSSSSAIIRDEIGQGEGANLVVGRHYRAAVADWGADKALTVFRRLLERERGAYWTYVFFTGDRFLIGASPERHVSVHGGDVRMNPISGTFRVPAADGGRAAPRCWTSSHDEKEIYELFMVVDEELKMMCDICHEGGQVLGPFLKPMTHLVHTEYLLAGRTDRDPREVLRDTMYAATVTGVAGRERLPADQEVRVRGPRLLRRRARPARPRREGGPDASTARSSSAPPTSTSTGRLTVTAGATLVRDSDAAYEVAETHAKAGGILSRLRAGAAGAGARHDVAELSRDEDVLLALNARNRRLAGSG